MSLDLHNEQKQDKLNSEWLKAFKKKVWSQLEQDQKRALCKRFGLNHDSTMGLGKVVKQMDTPIPPRAFVIAAVHKMRVEANDLIDKNPYDELWMDKISYDKDRWGVMRDNIPNYGLLKHTQTSVDGKQKREFEVLLRCSVSLNKFEKIRVLNNVPVLNEFQVVELIKTWKKEAKKFGELNIKHGSDVVRLVKRAEREWQEIEPYLEYHIAGKKIELDKYNQPTPRTLVYMMGEYIKGQDVALKEVAKRLYYHVHKKCQNSTQKPMLLSGATGSGKSFILQTGANIVGVPFLHIDCSSMVSAGIKGYGVEEAMKSLLRKTDFNLKEAEKSVIILDEVDKLMIHHDGDSIATQLLRLIEGADIQLNHSSHSEESEFKNIRSINTSKMLFFFAGSFQYMIEEKQTQSGFIKEVESGSSISIDEIGKTKLPPELLGRIGKVVVLNNLTKSDYKKILSDSKRSPIKRYQEMLTVNDVVHELNNEDIDEIVSRAMKSKYGARSLDQIVEEYFEDILFDAPSMTNNREKK